MRLQALNRELLGLGSAVLRASSGRTSALVVLFAAAVWVSPAGATPVYTETFNGPGVPVNWTAQNGTMGTATLGIADDAGGIGSGNALSVISATQQGVIGSFSETSFANVGDKIELSFDVRLTQIANNSGGFRFGLYHDNGGSPALSSGYRALMGTGTLAASTDVQADGGFTNIGFGTNRENPPGFQSDEPGFNDNDPHSLRLILTRTEMGVSIDVWQDGTSNYPAAVEHITGMGAGTPTPIQTEFNQIMFTTNGGYTGLIDNVQVKYTAIPEPTSLVLVGVGVSLVALTHRRLRKGGN